MFGWGNSVPALERLKNVFRHAAVGMFSHPDGWKSPWGRCEILKRVFVNWPSGFPQRSSRIVRKIARLGFCDVKAIRAGATWKKNKPGEDDGEMLRRPPVAQRPIITLPRIPALRELIIFVIPLDIRGAPSLFSGRSHCRVPRAAMMPSPSLLVPIFLCCCAWNKKKKNQITDVAARRILTESDWTLKGGCITSPRRRSIQHTHLHGENTHTHAQKIEEHTEGRESFYCRWVHRVRLCVQTLPREKNKREGWRKRQHGTEKQRERGETWRYETHRD